MLSCISFLLPGNKVWGKVIFHRHVSVILFMVEGASVWCHFLSGCLVPCSFQGRGSLSRRGDSVQGDLCPEGGLCPGGVSLRATPQTQTPTDGDNGTYSTGMLSCSSLILFLLNKQGYFIQLPVHLVLWPCCHAKIFFLVREYCY